MPQIEIFNDLKDTKSEAKKTENKTGNKLTNLLKKKPFLILVIFVSEKNTKNKIIWKA